MVPQFQDFASYGIPVVSFVLQAVSPVSRGIPVVAFDLQAAASLNDFDDSYCIPVVSFVLQAVSPVSRGIPVVAFDLQAAASLNDEHSFGGDTAASGSTASTCFCEDDAQINICSGTGTNLKK